MLSNPRINDGSSAPGKKGTHDQIKFISLLRASAALLVLWDHLAGVWPTYNKRSWIPTKIVESTINHPFQISQDFGWLGVCLFFLVSGFIITHVAMRESALDFLVKRVFRIFPPLWFAILLTVFVEWFMSPTPLQPGSGSYSIKQVLLAMTLFNYLMAKNVVVSGVAWTLIIEMSFYFLMWIMLPLLRRQPLLVTTFGLIIVGAALGTRNQFGESYFVLVVTLSYVPILFIGQAIYFRWSNRCSTLTSGALITASAGEFILGTHLIQPQMLQANADGSYAVSMAYAIAIFVFVLILNNRLYFPRFLEMIADSSYSLYLLHPVVGFYVLDVLTPHMPLTLSILIATIVSIVVAFLSHKFIEEPSRKSARNLLKFAHKTRSSTKSVQ